MPIWIFKVSEQELYPDTPGKEYVYDNTHSVHVQTGDTFIYLDKRQRNYGFTGHGIVGKVRSRIPTEWERRNNKIRQVFVAELEDMVRYSNPLDIRLATNLGRANRTKIGISNVNSLGWSASIAKIDEELFDRIIRLAYDAELVRPVPTADQQGYEIPDKWSPVRKRHSLEVFRRAVAERQNYRCLCCGTTLREILEVAHISPYAIDKKNRANPANGICLCAYCHSAYDSGVIRIRPDGALIVNESAAKDDIGRSHFFSLDITERRKLLEGVDYDLLQRRFQISRH